MMRATAKTRAPFRVFRERVLLDFVAHRRRTGYQSSEREKRGREGERREKMEGGVIVQRWERCRARMGTLKSLDEALRDGRGSGGNVGSGGQAVTLRKSLGWLELTLLGIGGIVGAGVFVLTGAGAKDFAGPAVVLSFLLAGLASFFSALCYTEFAVDVPLAGSAYNYVSITFGEFAAWICGWNLVLEYSVSCSAVARGWTSYMATLLGTSPDHFRIGSGIISLDPLAVVIIAVLTVVLIIGIKESATFNTVVTSVNLATIAVVLVVGVPSIESENYVPFAPFGVKGIFTGASIVFFSFIGFDTLATCAEEVKKPSRDMPIGIMGSLGICTILYVLMALTIAGMVPYQEIDIDAPFAAAFNLRGNRVVGFIVSLGAVTGIVTSLLVSLLGQTRIYMVIARDRLLPGWFGIVSERFRTPVNATITTGILSSLLAFFIDIDILATLVSIGTLFVFALVCAAVLMRRYSSPNVSGSRRSTLLRIGLVVLTSLATTTAYNANANIGVILTFLLLFIMSCFGFYYKTTTMYTPALFAAPFLPWVPAFGLFSNIFLIGSLGVAAYIRFIVWFVIGTAIYVFYGVDHSVIGKSGQQRPEAENEGYGSISSEMGRGVASDAGSLDVDDDDDIGDALLQS